MQKTKQRGAALLILTLILMTAAGLVIVFATSYSLLQQKTVANQQTKNKAFVAAEAGLDYAIAYLNANSTAIKATASGGSLNYTFTTTTQGDSSTYGAVITNPTANDYNRLQITATGTSPDGSTTRVISQEVYAQGSPVQYGITTRGNLTTGGSSSVTGTNGVRAGGNVTNIGISSNTTIVENDDTLADMTPENFFSSIFGGNYSTVKANSTNYSSGSGVPWSSLSGTVWINSNVGLTGNTTIGSPANPVALIVNGNFTVAGNVTVYGLIFTTGNISATGSFDANGGMAAAGNITMWGNSNVDYNATILNALNLAGTGGSSGTYSKLPGSWRDF